MLSTEESSPAHTLTAHFFDHTITEMFYYLDLGRGDESLQGTIAVADIDFLGIRDADVVVLLGESESGVDPLSDRRCDEDGGGVLRKDVRVRTTPGATAARGLGEKRVADSLALLLCAGLGTADTNGGVATILRRRLTPLSSATIKTIIINFFIQIIV